MPEIESLMSIAQALFTVKNPRTGEDIRFDLKRHQHKYLYFQAKGINHLYAYTPHHDTQGWYYSWVYQAKGAGARSGTAFHWHLTKLVAHRTRKAAKARALRLWYKQAAQKSG